MEPLEIIPTRDGSATLRNASLNETYHSVNGAMTESMHVFINNGLKLISTDKDSVHILEVGMGTGLNVLLTMGHIPAGKTIYYTALEPYPLDIETAVAYFNSFEKKPATLEHLQRIHDGDQNFRALQAGFVFRKTISTLQSLSISELQRAYDHIGQLFPGFDIIYYDAFGPQKQPEMWNLEPLSNAVRLLNEKGLLVSYCAQGQFKRHLKALQMRVESPAGPPGKRQMTVAFR